MKLLILYTKDRHEVFNKKSALGSYINYLGKLLNKNGFEVYLNGEQLRNVQDKSNSVVLTSNKLSFIKKIIPTSVKRYLREKKHLVDIDRFSEELVQGKVKYDLVLEYYNMGSDVGLKISKQQNIPYYIFYDGPILDEYEIFNHDKPFFFKEVVTRQKESFKHAQKIVAQSNPMKGYIVNNIEDCPNKIVIHQNVDYTKFDVLNTDKQFNTEELTLGFIGSFLPWHQVDMLLKAFKYVVSKGVNSNLLLIGDGMERQKMVDIVESFSADLKSKIKFTGFVTEQALYDYKCQIDIGIMPGSNWYGAPLKIFEYGAMKMACIAPNTPTITDLFPNNEVKFFEWKNQASLNQTLLEFCTNFEDMKNQAEKLHQYVVNRYSEKNTIDFYIDFLK